MVLPMPPDLPFFSALLSAGPHPDIPPEACIFAPFIGSWDLIVRWYEPSGEVRRKEAGEWHFAYVLEGRAVQDVWIVPPRGQRGRDDYEYGTSLRFYDAAADGWRSTWVGPMRGAVLTFLAQKSAEGVRLQTLPGQQPALRWSFYDVGTNHFCWRNEEAVGQSWHTLQSFEAKRQVHR